MDTDYTRVEHAIRYLDAHAARQPTLAEVARSVHLSEFHFQRLFRRWAGVTPKRFLQYLTVEHAKRLLAEGGGVLETSLSVGLSGPGRLHDLFVSLEAATPGEWKGRGAGTVVRWGVHDTPFGPGLAAATARGLCALRFLDATAGDEPARLAAEWPAARLVEEPSATAPWMARLFAGAAAEGPLPLHVRGTNFQVQVWRALLALPEGRVVSYEQVAGHIGRPSAVRAVASAVAANPVAFVIPCHRVIRKAGAFGEYRWGATRKRAMLGWESAKTAGSRA